jgi:nitroreductase
VGVESADREREDTVETWDAIRSRRNVRAYQDRTIEPEGLDRILEAARRTPSSQNQQRWDLVVVTDHDQLTELARVWRGARHIPGSAATIAVIAPATDEARVRESIQYDLGQLTMSIMLAAADLGIGTGHAAVHDQEAAREILGFPEGLFCAWLVGMGYPEDRPLRPLHKPSRRPFDDVVHRGRW